MSSRTFHDRTVCITGAARGLGAAIARRFAEAGAHVHVADVLDEEATQLAAELKSEGRAATAHHLDVSNEDDWRQLVAALDAAGGGLDVLVNNAGIIIRKSLAQTSKAEWDRAMSINVAGVFLGMQHCRPLLAAKAPAAIVNISSTAGIIAHGDPSYTASKWAVRGLTKSAALELSANGIRVNSVHPAMIATPLTFAAPKGHMEANRAVIPMGRESSPDEIANIVLFLASNEASFMTGSEVTADGGLTTGGVAHARSRLQASFTETQQS
ncbi:3-alpha-(or 20-beta)-hydroxysteroid dehydrogenase [Hyphomicrobiales bacterium]|nr:3-alpha-(or 20-beta)-hydroxysteroid dehydrogenase [Hyphomicrobiales bacterium]CAH1663573.1 3-alpha-(or 20-beta)-hydroxysteroid dehydrogenase [Hyphomicrobiales bacterium]